MEEKQFFLCDPVLNTNCPKTGCFLYGGECRSTSHAQFATPQLMSMDKAISLTRIKDIQEPLRPEDHAIRVPDPGKEVGYRLVSTSNEEE